METWCQDLLKQPAPEDAASFFAQDWHLWYVDDHHQELFLFARFGKIWATYDAFPFALMPLCMYVFYVFWPVLFKNIVSVYYDSLYGGSVGLRQIFPPLSCSDFLSKKARLKSEGFGSTRWLDHFSISVYQLVFEGSRVLNSMLFHWMMFVGIFENMTSCSPLNLWRGHLTIPKRSPAEMPGEWWSLLLFFSFLKRVISFQPHEKWRVIYRS